MAVLALEILVQRHLQPGKIDGMRAVHIGAVTGHASGDIFAVYGDDTRVRAFLTDSRGFPFMDAVKELAGKAGMEVPAPDPRAVDYLWTRRPYVAC